MAYYVGICSEKGKVVGDEQALTYALCRIMEREDEQEGFLDWYYSGDWIKMDQGEI